MRPSLLHSFISFPFVMCPLSQNNHFLYARIELVLDFPPSVSARDMTFVQQEYRWGGGVETGGGQRGVGGLPIPLVHFLQCQLVWCLWKGRKRRRRRLMGGGVSALPPSCCCDNSVFGAVNCSWLWERERESVRERECVCVCSITYTHMHAHMRMACNSKKGDCARQIDIFRCTPVHMYYIYIYIIYTYI